MAEADSMTDRTKELEAAANDITPASLQAAKDAIAINCREYLRWALLFSRRLETIKPEELHKFARALSLTILGHLPTRPATCPFCIQYDRDQACTGCGYAETHGRCDADDSAFSLFIEAFQDLGRVIYQETTANKSASYHVKTKELLFCLLQASQELAREMMEGLASLSTLQLMRQKQIYIDRMILQLPFCLFSKDVKKQCRILQHHLERYW
jgi:hypothetical protein